MWEWFVQMMACLPAIPPVSQHGRLREFKLCELCPSYFK